jgi:hypothetical protein
VAPGHGESQPVIRPITNHLPPITSILYPALRYPQIAKAIPIASRPENEHLLPQKEKLEDGSQQVLENKRKSQK